jgi:hypothetical protein
MNLKFFSPKKPSPQDRKSGITFPVDDVTPARTPLPVQALSAEVAHRAHRKVFAVPDPEMPVVQSANVHHALLAAVDTAFREHRPLTLSPDSIWLTIAQGFSHHLLENAESLRGRLVRHDGSRELTATFEHFKAAEIAAAIRSFSSQIREASDPVLHESLLCDFSTTTPAIRTASEIVLMDSYSTYFTYKMRCVCGIPEVTLHGSVEDWERIRARVEVLATYGLEWWVGRLRPILDELVLTAAGRPNRTFWQAIYKPKNAYATFSVTGWIADLFPYLGNDPGKRRRSHVFDHVRQDWALPVPHGVRSTPMHEAGCGMGVYVRTFPCGLSSVPVKVTKFPGTEAIDLVGGFLAVEQHPKTLSLFPVISWCMTAPKPASPVMLSPF